MPSNDHAIVLGTVDLVSPVAAATALDVLLAAEIVTAAPQPVQLIGIDALQMADGAGGFLYAQVALVKFQ